MVNRKLPAGTTAAPPPFLFSFVKDERVLQMAEIEKDLLEIERKFWTGNEAYYREHVDTSCLVAFTEMSGLMSNSDLAATVKDANRWQKLDLRSKGLVQPTGDVAILTYEASAERADGEPYQAIVSTGYVRRNDGWKMMFHSQAPLEKKQPS